MTARTFRFNVVSSNPGIPAWASAIGVGQIANIGTNTMQSQKPTATDNVGVVNSWSGGVYAPTLGAHGSFLQYGGGHSNYQMNEVYRFDLSSATWARMVEPTLPLVVGPNGYATDETYFEYWADAAGNLRTGSVGANHTYGKTVWVPQAANLDGLSNPLGYLVAPVAGSTSNAAGPVVANASTRYPHYVPLSTGTSAWARYGGDPFETGSGGFMPALYDSSSRNRIVRHVGNVNNPSGPTSTFEYLDLTNRTSGTFTTLASVYGYYGSAFYDSANDLYMVAVYYNGTFRVSLINPTTRAVTVPQFAGTLPTVYSGGFDWIQSLKRLVYYPGSGQDVWWAQQPADPTQAWAWTKVMMTGATAVAQAGTSPHYMRFRYVPSLDLFFWLPTNTTQQAFRIW